MCQSLKWSTVVAPGLNQLLNYNVWTDTNVIQDYSVTNMTQRLSTQYVIPNALSLFLL